MYLNTQGRYTVLQNLIQSDIVLMRSRYDEALQLQGIACKYQFPNIANTNYEGDPVVDSYSEEIETHIFFDNDPKIKTIKRYGWVIANSDDLPFLVHCSWNLPHVQKDSIFRFSGQYSEVNERIFRVTALSYDLQCADHLVAQVVPCYDEKNLVGRTEQEIKKTFNKSNHFLKEQVDYRGDYYKVKEDVI